MNNRFASFQQQRQQNGPPANLNEMLQSVAARFIPQGMTPEMMVRQLMQSGKMTQEQFQRFAETANQWTGQRR